MSILIHYNYFAPSLILACSLWWIDGELTKAGLKAFTTNGLSQRRGQESPKDRIESNLSSQRRSAPPNAVRKFRAPSRTPSVNERHWRRNSLLNGFLVPVWRWSGEGSIKSAFKKTWAFFWPFSLKIAGWGATAASAGAYHAGGIAAAAAAMKGTTDLGPHSGYHPAHHQLMADMYQGMSPATAINTMDWKNTSQVSLRKFREIVKVLSSTEWCFNLTRNFLSSLLATRLELWWVLSSFDLLHKMIDVLTAVICDIFVAICEIETRGKPESDHHHLVIAQIW